MSTDADDDGDVPFPLGVRIAAWIWTGVGGLMVVFLCLIAIPYGASIGLFTMCFLCVVALVAMIGSATGLGLLHGVAEDTLSVGIGSIVVGVIELGIAIYLTVLSMLFPVPAPDVTSVGFFGGQGMLFLAAGVLAVRGRRQYREWRHRLDWPIKDESDNGPSEPQSDGPE